MASLQDVLIARLTGDTTLMAILTGGVWNRPLKQSGPGNTAAAWTTNAQGVKHLQPCAILLDPDEAKNASNWASDRAIAIDDNVSLALWAEATDSGKAAIRAADLRSQALFHQWQAVADDGIYTVTVSGDRVAIVDSTDFPGTLITSRRFSCTTARVLVEVN